MLLSLTEINRNFQKWSYLERAKFIRSKGAQLCITRAVANVCLRAGINKINHLEIISTEFVPEFMDIADIENIEEAYSQSSQDNPLGEGSENKEALRETGRRPSRVTKMVP